MRLSSILILLSVLCVPSAFADDQSLLAQIDTLSKRIEVLEARLLAIPKAEEKQPAETVDESKNKSGLQLLSAQYEYVEKYDKEFYKIDYTLKNNAQKDIKLLKARIIFEDLLGDKVFGITLQRDVKLIAGESQTITAYFEIRSIRWQRDIRMKSMNSDDVIRKLDVEALVYADGEIYNQD